MATAHVLPGWAGVNNVDPVGTASIPTGHACQGVRRGPGWRIALTAPLWLIPLWLLLASTLPTSPFTTLSGCVTVVLLAVCSYTDIRSGKIRNSVTYTAMLWALTIGSLHSLCGPPLLADSTDATLANGPELVGLSAARVSEALGEVGLGESVAGAALAFVVMLFVYRLAGGGAGDVKLATVLGALLGPARAIDAILWTYVLAGVAIVVCVLVAIGPIALLQWLARKVASRLLPTRIAPPAEHELRLLQGKLQLGPYFAMGTMAVLSGAGEYLLSAIAGS